jgi:hypothetical protein
VSKENIKNKRGVAKFAGERISDVAAFSGVPARREFNCFAPGFSWGFLFIWLPPKRGATTACMMQYNIRFYNAIYSGVFSM